MNDTNWIDTHFKLLFPDACWINLPTSVDPVNATVNRKIGHVKRSVATHPWSLFDYLYQRPGEYSALLRFCRDREWHSRRHLGSRPLSSTVQHRVQSNWFVRLVSRQPCCQWQVLDRISRLTSEVGNSREWFVHTRPLAHGECKRNNRHPLESFCLHFGKKQFKKKINFRIDARWN